jgi:NAD(P)H dehydrogenase (quinone)
VSNIVVIYYSSTGHVHKLAEAVAKGASDAGAEARVRRVPELAPEEVIRGQEAWHDHYTATVDVVAEATLDDLKWADGFALGSPTRYGLPASQLKQFIDQTGPLWLEGHLSNKVATSFTSSINAHAGQESTLLAINNVFYHWGCLIVPPGFTHPVVTAAGGNPYGTSYVSMPGDDSVSGEALLAAHYQGYRLAQYARRLVARPAGSSDGREGDAESADPLAHAPYDPPTHYAADAS